jgi:hypothetical protein
MTWLWQLNLFHFFDFYLALAFLLSTVMRFRQYEAIIRLVRAVPDRWPRLLKLVREHHTIFLTWSTGLPAFLALILWLLNTLACRLVWPQALLTVSDLGQLWLALPMVIVFGAGMLCVDIYATFSVGEVDGAMMEKYFDQAEYWLRSWIAPVVHIFTLGFFNPRKIVAVEVRRALVEASRLLNNTLWWVTVQVGLRIAFGLALWSTWALS